jgi:hypothetical protein
MRVEPTALLSLLRQQGVHILTSGPQPYSRWDDEARRYEVCLGEGWERLVPEAQTVILAHEIGHIVRGDCVREGPWMQDARLKYIANVAQDVVINASLDEHIVCEHLNGVTWERLYGHLPPEQQPPRPPGGWKPIYDYLSQRCSEGYSEQSDQGDGSDGTGCGVRYDSASDPLAEMAARVAIAGKIIDQAPDLAAALGATPVSSATRREVSLQPPAADPLLAALMQTVQARGFGHVTREVRSWSRPGRLEGIYPGRTQRSYAHIAVYVDRSGSMTVTRAAERVGSWAREQRCEVYAFADRVGTLTDDVGCGTAFQPVFDHATRLQPDAVVLLTDGMAGDRYTIPDACPPVIIGLTHDYEVTGLRKRDRCIRLRVSG